jgi:menaquinone-9 beta-reductase
MPGGVGALMRLGLADAIGGAPFYGVRYYMDGLVAEGRFPAASGVPAAGRGQRRRHLDQVLFAAAAATSGVSARTGMRVDAPLWERERVVGLIVAGQERRAPLVVVADGARSHLRRLLGLDSPSPRRRRLGVRAHFRLAHGHVQPPWVEIFLGQGYELYVTPLPEGEILVAGLAEQGRLIGGAEASLLRWVGEQPLLRARLEGAERRTALRGMSPLSCRARAGVTPGAVLLGDAAGCLDPITGGGMAQALLSAELLAHAITQRRCSSDTWLWAYDRARQMLLRDERLLTQAVLELAAHPWLARQALRVLRAMPALFSSLIGIAGGVHECFYRAGLSDAAHRACLR